MQIRKILLIWPYIERCMVSDKRAKYNFPNPRFPLGIGYVAAHLEKNGYEVEVLDLMAENAKPSPPKEGRIRWGLEDEEIKKRIKQSNADVVGVSQMFSYLEDICKNIFSIAKEVNPHVINVWGGTHPSSLPKECLAFPLVDYVIIGEGELAILELLKRLNNNEPLEGIKSVSFRKENKEIYFTNNRYWIEDLDSHTHPARHLFDMNRYAIWRDGLRAFNMVSSRGCPFACTFCTAPSFYQKRYRSRTPERVVDEMEYLVNEHGATMVVMDDENLTSDMKRIEKIMDVMIERRVKTKWFAEVGLTISKLSPSIINKMKATGFTELRLALESGDAAMLRTMKKPLVLRKALEVVGWGREANIRMVSFLLMGMPGETLEQMERTVEFADLLGFDWSVISMVLPLPGTQIHADLTSEGFELNFKDLERYTLPVEGVSEVSSETLAEFREKANNRLNFENNFNLTRGDVNKAIADFEYLAKSYPNLEKIWYYLGIAYYKKGEAKKALEMFKKCAAINNSKFKNVSAWIASLDNVSSFLSYKIEKQLNYKYGRKYSKESEAVSLGV